MFDPYRKWLGIPPKDQPPNHYRLLALELFESDLDVIEGAAERQMSFVRQYQSGEHAAAAARILNELASARLCLLKPATKSAYDAKLRTELAPPEPEPTPDFPDLPMSDTDPGLGTSRRKRKNKSGKSPSTGLAPQLMIGGGIAAAVCILLFVFALSGRRQRPVETPQNLNTVAVTTPEKVPADEVATESTRSANDPAGSMLWADTKLVTEPAGQPVDLLKLVDLSRDVVTGKWQQTNSALIGDPLANLQLPTRLPDDYQLKFDVRRLEGNDTLFIGFMMAGRQGMLAFDGWNSTASGLYVDGREPIDNCTTRRGKLFVDQTLGHIVLTIHSGHLHVTFDGKTIVDWHGDPQRLHLYGLAGLASRESPFVITAHSKYVIESATLTPIKPEVPLSRPARLDREVDVLPLMDSERDAGRGIWAISKNALNSPEGRGTIYLPTVIPEEYTVSATVELPPENQGDYVLTIGLIAGTSCFQFAWTRHGTGLDMIDGRPFDKNESRLAVPLLKPGVPTRIACTVTGTGIRMDADGKTLIDWRGDIRRLSLPGDWALPDARRFYLGSISHLKFRDIKLGPPLPAPKPPDHPPYSIGKPVDLLTRIDPARDAFGGTWEREGTALTCRGDAEWNKLAVPFQVPDEYKLTMRVTRMAGGEFKNEVLNMGLPLGNSKADISIDSRGSTLSGVYCDYGQTAIYYRGGPVIPSGATQEIVFLLTKTGLKVTREGMTLFDWKGNPDRLSVQVPWATPGRRLSLGSWKQSFRFEKLELEQLPPTSFPPVEPLGVDGKLLSIINADRDARLGDWTLEGDALTCRTKAASRFNIPVPVPKSYVLSAMVERIEGNRQLNLGLLVDGYPCCIVIDADEMHNAGIDLLDGKRYFEDANLVRRNYKTPLLPPNQRVPVRCTVLPDTIVVTCGDKEVIRWHGDARRLSMLNEMIPPNDSEDDRTHLFLGSWESGFAFRDLELKPLNSSEADQMSKSFSGVFPATPQQDVPFATIAASVETTVTTPDTSLPATAPSTPPVSRQPAPAAKLGEWTDLLDWAADVEWAPRGINWNDNIEGPATRSGIRMKSAPAMRFPLPAIIDGDYEMEVEFTRAKGEEAVAVYFPVGIHTIRLLLGTDTGTVSHVSFVDEKEFGERRPAPISNGQRHRVVIRVHREGDKASFNIDWDDVKDYIHWEGAETSLRNTDGSNWLTNMIQHPWIGAWNNDVTFQKVRVRMNSGTIRRDSITDADRDHDLKDGFVRLVGEQASAVKVGFGQFVTNQIPLEFYGPGLVENNWPLITREFKVCDDFYSAHAPSRIKCAIPKGAKSFSAIGYNDAARLSKYVILIDGKPVYESGITAIAVAKVDIPPKSSLLELTTEAAKDANPATTSWCYPRFHSMTAEKVKDKMLDDAPGPLRFVVASGTAGFGEVAHNKPSPWVQSIPIHFRDALPCDEFLFAHAASTVSYRVPEGMTRFTAIAYNVISHSANYEVWADATRIYEGPRAGIIPIDVKLPRGTKLIELKINDMDGASRDHSIWCYPRLHRK
ncbi:MAG: NPCBM/NEW2 domain-containing protein [Planctomycetes bacterium]|nr:NPCBM/NEW2 domain-containing protein [Planctomycetota bacterium]